MTLANQARQKLGKNEAQNSLVLLCLKAAQTLSSENALSSTTGHRKVHHSNVGEHLKEATQRSPRQSEPGQAGQANRTAQPRSHKSRNKFEPAAPITTPSTSESTTPITGMAAITSSTTEITLEKTPRPNDVERMSGRSMPSSTLSDRSRPHSIPKPEPHTLAMQAAKKPMAAAMPPITGINNTSTDTTQISAGKNAKLAYTLKHARIIVISWNA